ncbi:MAG: hypothetical protein JWM10_3210 [Myxococcaceae bacterium]|nr:hypothetical protein [Myxococcaceae bacterium]
MTGPAGPAAAPFGGSGSASPARGGVVAMRSSGCAARSRRCRAGAGRSGGGGVRRSTTGAASPLGLRDTLSGRGSRRDVPHGVAARDASRGREIGRARLVWRRRRCQPTSFRPAERGRRRAPHVGAPPPLDAQTVRGGPRRAAAIRDVHVRRDRAAQGVPAEACATEAAAGAAMREAEPPAPGRHLRGDE